MNAALATDPQMRFLRKLIAERDFLSLAEPDRALVRHIEAGRTPSKRDAHRLIDTLKNTALGRSVSDDGAHYRRAAQPSDDLTRDDAGVYRKSDGTMLRVYYGQQSGKMLVKQLNQHADGSWSYDYLGLAARFLGDAKRVTLEEAKEFGRMTETCCMCGLDLDVPESVEAGIGPKCARKFR